MRHGNKINNLGRTYAHRAALLKNLAISLIAHKRIETTLAKAKELRKFIEPLITKAKNDTTHSRRTVFSYLQDKESIKTLFGEVANKVAERNGGYTRIIKLGFRQGDNAEVALIELVDFNEALLTAVEEKSAKTRRSRRGGKKSETSEAAVTGAEVVEDAPAAVETAAAEVVAEATVEAPAVAETSTENEESKEA